MAQAPKPPVDIPPSAEASDPLLREALAWLVHLHSGAETPDDWASFQDWKAASPQHAETACSAEKLWQRLAPALSTKRPRSPGASVIVTAGLGIAFLAFALGLFGSPRSYFADYSTGVGEMRTVSLQDGSRVDLDTATSFDVEDQGRTIKLHRGQIFITVAPNRAKPFTVIAGNGSAEALGTAFAVRRDGDAVSVAVTEHVVRVSYGDGSGRQSADIAAGEGVEYTPQHGLGTRSKIDVTDRIGWRQGQLVFNDRPLGEVLHELQRYRRGRIVILDSTIETLPVTGTHNIAEIDDLLESLQVALPIHILSLPGAAMIWRDASRSGPALQK